MPPTPFLCRVRRILCTFPRLVSTEFLRREENELIRRICHVVQIRRGKEGAIKKCPRKFHRVAHFSPSSSSLGIFSAPAKKKVLEGFFSFSLFRPFFSFSFRPLQSFLVSHLRNFYPREKFVFFSPHSISGSFFLFRNIFKRKPQKQPRKSRRRFPFL